jgi:hypothetical protein
MRLQRVTQAFVLAVLIGACCLIARTAYVKSTYAEAFPLNELRKNLNASCSSIGRDLVDGYWVLEFRGSQADDAQVIRAMPYLRALPTGTPIDALDYNRSFVIRIESTNITDSGIEQLAVLPIAQLLIEDSPITDKSLKSLHSQDGLTSVTLARTRVTDAGISELEAALPKCQVSRDRSGITNGWTGAVWPFGISEPTTSSTQLRARLSWSFGVRAVVLWMNDISHVLVVEFISMLATGGRTGL